jgi:hypothetical protein
LSVVCCQVEISATGWSLVQRSPTDCGASLCVIKKPRGRGGHSPRWAAEPEKIIIVIACTFDCVIMSFEPLMQFSGQLMLSESGTEHNYMFLIYLKLLLADLRAWVRNVMWCQATDTIIKKEKEKSRYLFTSEEKTLS